MAATGPSLLSLLGRKIPIAEVDCFMIGAEFATADHVRQLGYCGQLQMSILQRIRGGGLSTIV